MSQFTVGDQVFPKWSQYLPAFKVSQVGAVMISIVDEWGNTAFMHKDDIVARDPAASYEAPRYSSV